MLFIYPNRINDSTDGDGARNENKLTDTNRAAFVFHRYRPFTFRIIIAQFRITMYFAVDAFTTGAASFSPRRAVGWS